MKRSVEHHFYALMAAMLDVGRTPEEIRAGLAKVMAEFRIAPINRGRP
jgi:hypothetical protein